DAADARLRRHAGLRARLARGGAPAAERREAPRARREPRRRRDAHFASRDDDARLGPRRSASGARHHRRPRPHLRRHRGHRGSEGRSRPGARRGLMGPLDFVLHFDTHLTEFVRDYGTWVYAILFTIVFAETGFVVTPFLPGDSLLFAAGALCATGRLNAPAMLGLLVFAAVAGNTVNYTVGRLIGPRVFQSSHRLLNRQHLDRAHVFFEQYGGKSVILGRFVPIVRTFVPFVAGAAQMTT